MEPLNLMVSLSHFANENPKNKHGLSTPAGRRRKFKLWRLGGRGHSASVRYAGVPAPR